MAQNNPLEVWMRGAIPQIPTLLQPVAHAILQAQEEVNALLETVPDTLLWVRPSNVASIGFHLQHLSGVLDRLFTYARGEALSEAQLADLTLESIDYQDDVSVSNLIVRFNHQLEKALDQLKNTPEETLTETRYLGRKKIPTTQLGLLFHAAEHTQRHLGQLLVTIRVLQNQA
ncbi:MAG: DinB family protein [Spirosomataceae bacterium]